MQHSKNLNRFVCLTEVHGVRERVLERAPDVAGDCGKLLRPLANPFEHLIDVAKEPRSETSLFIVVPVGGLLEIGLRQRPNDEPSVHSL
jgi:hypothetical protein